MRVQEYFNRIHLLMCDVRPMVGLRREFSDGAGDFKSHIAFLDIGLSYQLYGIAREHNSSVAGRGKDDVDRTGGEFGGAIKSMMELAERADVQAATEDVSGKQAVSRRPSNAEEIGFMLRTHTDFFERTFKRQNNTVVRRELLVMPTNAFRARNSSVLPVGRNLEGSRILWWVATPPENKNLAHLTLDLWRGEGTVNVLKRRLSCGCVECGAQRYASCLRKHIVGEVKSVALKYAIPFKRLAYKRLMRIAKKYLLSEGGFVTKFIVKKKQEKEEHRKQAEEGAKTSEEKKAKEKDRRKEVRTAARKQRKEEEAKVAVEAAASAQKEQEAATAAAAALQAQVAAAAAEQLKAAQEAAEQAAQENTRKRTDAVCGETCAGTMGFCEGGQCTPGKWFCQLCSGFAPLRFKEEITKQTFLCSGCLTQAAADANAAHNRDVNSIIRERWESACQEASEAGLSKPSYAVYESITETARNEVFARSDGGGSKRRRRN